MNKNQLMLSAIASMALVTVSSAQYFSDDFNDASDGVSFPTGTDATWSSSGQTGTGLTKVTSESAESPFSADVDGLGVLVTDTSSTLGISTGIQTSFGDAIVSGDSYSVSLDYKIIDSGNNDISLNLVFGTGSSTPQGSFLHLWQSDGDGGGNLAYNDGTVNTLTALSLDTWYHVDVEYNMVAGRDSFSVTLTEFGGSSQTFSDLDFRHTIYGADQLTIINNSNGSRTGSWAVDNVSAIPEPSTFAYALFIAVGAMFYGSRRKAR